MKPIIVCVACVSHTVRYYSDIFVAFSIEPIETKSRYPIGSY